MDLVGILTHYRAYSLVMGILIGIAICWVTVIVALVIEYDIATKFIADLDLVMLLELLVAAVPIVLFVLASLFPKSAPRRSDKSDPQGRYHPSDRKSSNDDESAFVVPLRSNSAFLYPLTCGPSAQVDNVEAEEQEGDHKEGKETGKKDDTNTNTQEENNH